jgi:hypothetical protein
MNLSDLPLTVRSEISISPSKTLSTACASFLGMVEEDSTSLLALYQRPREVGDFGYFANAVKVFFGRSGIILKSTVRAISVIGDIVAERVKS